MKLYAATKNKGKILEINKILHDAGIECESFPNMEDVEETGTTFEENAKIKADYLSSKLKDVYVIADDSGLSVESLGGAPGVYSARYAGNHGDDNANNKKLIHEMQGKKIRKCKYECVIALSKNGKTIKTFYGHIDGEVAEYEKGSGGFTLCSSDGCNVHFLPRLPVIKICQESHGLSYVIYNKSWNTVNGLILFFAYIKSSPL